MNISYVAKLTPTTFRNKRIIRVAVKEREKRFIKNNSSLLKVVGGLIRALTYVAITP